MIFMLSTWVLQQLCNAMTRTSLPGINEVGAGAHPTHMLRNYTMKIYIPNYEFR